MSALLEWQDEDEGTKWCPRCETTKPIEEFGINRARPDGRKSYCKPCQAAYSAARPRKPVNADDVRARYGDELPERQECSMCGHELLASAFSLNRRNPSGLESACKECRSETRRAAYEADLEGNREKQRLVRAANLEEHQAWDRARYQRDRDKRLAAAKEYGDRIDAEFQAGLRTPATEKECNRCGRTKPASSFTPNRRHPNGLQATCLDCYAEEDVIRRASDPEYRDRRNASSAASQALYEDKYRAKAKETRENRTPEQIAEDAAYNHAYYEAHKEEIAEASHKWYLANADAQRAASKIRGRRNYLANPQPALDRADQRRARQRGLPWEKIDRPSIYERDGWCCGICGGKVDRESAWPEPWSPSLDHIIPISHDGPHLATNVRLAHLRCNIGRGNRLGLNGDQLLLIG